MLWAALCPPSSEVFFVPVELSVSSLFDHVGLPSAWLLSFPLCREGFIFLPCNN
jgi:hypothetical protein